MHVLASFQLLCGSKDDVFNSTKDILTLVEELCNTQKGKEDAGKVFLLPLIKELQDNRSPAVKTLIAECVNCLLQGAPENVQLFVKKRAANRDLKAIVSLINTSPDYHMQGVLIEVLYRITRRDKNKWSPIFEDNEIDEAFWKITGRSFRNDVRSFLNIFNDKLGAARQIFSFKFRKLFLNEMEVVGSENEWIDFGPTNICFWITSQQQRHESVQCYIPFDTLVKTEINGSYLVFKVSESADLPEEIVDPHKKKPQLVSILLEDRDIEAIKLVIDPLATRIKYKKQGKSIENKSPEKAQKVSKAVLQQMPAADIRATKKVLQIPRLQVSSAGQRDNASSIQVNTNSKQRQEQHNDVEVNTGRKATEAVEEPASQTTQIGNMTFEIRKNKKSVESQSTHQSLFKEVRDNRPVSPFSVKTSRPPSPIEVALGVKPLGGKVFTPLPSPTSPLSKSLKARDSVASNVSGPSSRLAHKLLLTETDEISPEKPEYLDREHLQPRRLFESPLPIPPAMTSSSPKPDQIDEIISEENSLEDEMDVIPIETRIMGRDPSSNDLMKNILERIKSLEKMTTNQKMRREIELTLKQLRQLETKFSEYNREHVHTILNDFSAGMYAKLDQFLKDKERETEIEAPRGTKRKLIELTNSLQEECKKMKLLHRQVTSSIQSAEEILKESEMQRLIIQNQENRASRQLESDVESLKEEVRSDLEQFKTSLQPLFKGTGFFRHSK